MKTSLRKSLLPLTALTLALLSGVIETLALGRARRRAARYR